MEWKILYEANCLEYLPKFSRPGTFGCNLTCDTFASFNSLVIALVWNKCEVSYQKNPGWKTWVLCHDLAMIITWSWQNMVMIMPRWRHNDHVSWYDHHDSWHDHLFHDSSVVNLSDKTFEILGTFRQDLGRLLYDHHVFSVFYQIKNGFFVNFHIIATKNHFKALDTWLDEEGIMPPLCRVNKIERRWLQKDKIFIPVIIREQEQVPILQ